MAQDAPVARPADPLFDSRPDRLGPRLHRELFGALPARTARALDVAEVAAAVRPLLERGWRPAQLAARVGALPAAPDDEQAVLAVTAFLGQLLERDSPQRVWERERAERARASAQGRVQQVATDEARAHWVAEARRSLGLPARARAAPPVREVPACASCGCPGEFFVTRQVRLCSACVELLAQGRGRLAVDARAG